MKQDDMDKYKDLAYRERDLIDYFRKLPEDSKVSILQFLKSITENYS